MRKEFANVMSKELNDNCYSVLLLGDIGVHGHRDSLRKFPERAFNIGILEQSMVSFAAGLAIAGMHPTVHTIAPFLVERAFEQIKIDFGYQALGGNFVSVGGSVDYASLGATHHCPADVGLMLNIPNSEIYTPGTSNEFANLYSGACRNNKISYFRLSEKEHSQSTSVAFQRASVLQSGKLATVLAVGPILDLVVQAAMGLDVSILYYNTIAPFDVELLRSNLPSGKLLIVEPFYENTMATVIQEKIRDRFLMVRSRGIPRRFITNYGTTDQHYESIGLTPQAIKHDIVELMYG